MIKTDESTSASAPGISAATLAEAFQATVRDRGDSLALNAFGGDSTYTWNEYATAVEETAAGLSKLGIRRGDTVAIMLPNSPEFHIVDMAALHLGATPFSIYLTSAPEQINFLFDNAANTVVVTEQRFLEILGRTAAPLVGHVVVTDSADDLPAQIRHQLRALVHEPRRVHALHQRLIQLRLRQLRLQTQHTRRMANEVGDFAEHARTMARSEMHHPGTCELPRPSVNVRTRSNGWSWEGGSG